MFGYVVAYFVIVYGAAILSGWLLKGKGE